MPKVFTVNVSIHHLYFLSAVGDSVAGVTCMVVFKYLDQSVPSSCCALVCVNRGIACDITVAMNDSLHIWGTTSLSIGAYNIAAVPSENMIIYRDLCHAILLYTCAVCSSEKARPKELHAC